jgi:hypothetical protein
MQVCVSHGFGGFFFLYERLRFLREKKEEIFPCMGRSRFIRKKKEKQPLLEPNAPVVIPTAPLHDAASPCMAACWMGG